MEPLDRLKNFPEPFKKEITEAIKKCAGVNQFEAWLRRFNQLSSGVESESVTYRQVEDHIFELKVMCFLLETDGNIVITYEPKGIDPLGKNCDLLVKTNTQCYLIEMKCTHPEMREKEIPHEHITENNKLYMDPELYHLYQSARGHLMDFAKHTEEKIENYGKGYKTVLATVVGFHLNIEDLRDFVFIYRFNSHRADDPLGKITMHNLKKPYNGTIDEFWALPFYQDGFDFMRGRNPISVGPVMRRDIVLGKMA